MSQSEVKRYDKEYIVLSGSVQSALDALVIIKTQCMHGWEESGKGYLNMTSQLMNQNVGHQHPKRVQAIKDQAEKLCFVTPGVACESRSFLGKAPARLPRGT